MQNAAKPLAKRHYRYLKNIKDKIQAFRFSTAGKVIRDTGNIRDKTVISTRNRWAIGNYTIILVYQEKRKNDPRPHHTVSCD